MGAIQKLQIDHAQILYVLDLGEKNFFFMKILLILPKFHEKSLSRPGDIKIFCPGRRNYMYTLPYLWTKSLCLQQKIVHTKCLIQHFIL